MKIIDISMDITPDMTVWKNRTERRPQFFITRDYSRGDPARETQVRIDMHTGTHIDAPLHFVEGGAAIAETTLKSLVRPVTVLDLTSVDDAITAGDLHRHDIAAGDFLLCKTKNSFRDDWDDSFVFLRADGADYLKQMQIAGVGTDALGIERSQPDHKTHRSLLGSSIIIIEGLRLAHVEAGRYFMVAAPLKIIGVEAAPARIFLMAGEVSADLQ